MFLSDVSVKKPVLATMIILVFVVLGFFSYQRLSIDLMPKVDFPFVTITIVYPGAGPKEVESQITEIIEEEAISVSNVKRVESYSQENISIVMIEFELGINVDIAAIEVKDKIDAIRFKLPHGAEQPSIVKFDIGASPIMDLAVSGSRSLEEIFELTDKTLKDQLTRVDGVASIDVVGGKEREIQVNLSKEKLRGYGLSIMNVAQAVAMGNLSVPAGHITQTREEFTVRLLGEFTNLQQLRDLDVFLPNGGGVKLSELGTIADNFKDQRKLARYNGEANVGISIRKRADANAVRTAGGVLKTLERVKKILPNDVNIIVVNDDSIFIKDSVKDVIMNIIIGIILTSIVLYFFLHTLRATIIVSITMPASIIATFLLIYAAGFTLNVMSLMALGLSIGMLVANSIVVLENIIRHQDLGDSPTAASLSGTSEIAIAVAASALTNIVVFAPIGFMSGIVGKFFKEFGLTVVFATIFSLLMSFTLTPMLASKLLKKRRTDEDQRGFMTSFFRGWDNVYDKLAQGYRGTLEWTLGHRLVIVSATIVVFVFSIFLFRFIGGEFIPNIDQGVINVNVEMPPGTSLQKTDEALTQIESIIEKVPEVGGVFSTLGEGNRGDEGVEFARVLVILKKERTRLTSEVSNEIRSLLEGKIPDANVAIKISSMGAGGSDIQIEITGSEPEQLAVIAQKVKAIIDGIPGTADAKTSVKTGKPELTIVPDRNKLKEYGVTVAQLGGTLRASLTGEVASLYKEKDEEYDIRVRLAETDRDIAEDANQLLIQTQKGLTPVATVGEIVQRESETRIIRKNKQRFVTVEANIVKGTLSEINRQIRAQTDQLQLPSGYSIFFGGQAEAQAESFGSIFTALVMAIILTYMLLAAIMGSYIHPFTIMITLPLGLIGAVIALFVTGVSINIFSLMAIVMLVGVVVNNAILLIDYTTVLRERGYDIREALLEACPIRLRPVLMTNIAIAVGMLPQALGTGGAATLRASMAIVTIGGIIVSTLFTLYVIPAVYTAMDRLSIRKYAVSEAEVVPGQAD
ncbi:efflux RND transporter permease subunit [Candidatus Poribacteria bacterium]|nr:efflux RND transporter permease subunit [Candidatus Poribacteria bacterium]